MEWAQRCGEFVDVTLAEEHRVDFQVEVKGAVASSVEGRARRPTDFNGCQGSVQYKYLGFGAEVRAKTTSGVRLMSGRGAS